MRARTRVVLVSILYMAIGRFIGLAAPTDFFLKDGDTVVFYGDSITEQNHYNQFVELYAVTRFPAMRVAFFGAGVGGDRVSGGAGGTIEERLTRDVFIHRPTVVTIMLGMNDGRYVATTPEIRDAYLRGYEHLLDSLKTNAPGARITLLGPSPFDDITRPVTFPGGYNAVMQSFAEMDREMAQKNGAAFVSLNPAVVAVLRKAQELNPQMARLIIPDRVHPETIAHWAMAEALLVGWNAPPIVSSVTLDGNTGTVSGSQNANVEILEHGKDKLLWTETEKALPLPLNGKNEEYGLLLKLTDIQERLNRETLCVNHLESGRYKLSIDDGSIGTFTAEELGKGINLAEYETPMRSQAQRVGWAMRDRDQAHFIHMRMLIKKAETGPREGGKDMLDKFEDSLENEIYETAQPKPHRFSLARLAEAP